MAGKIPKFVQRDLEDQIREELQYIIDKSKESCKLNINNQSLKTQFMSTDQAQAVAPEVTSPVAAPKEVKTIKISEVLSLLKQGYVRTKKQDKNNTGKSIQEYYGINQTATMQLFDHPKLKGKKTKTVSLNIIDDAPDEAVIKTEKKPFPTKKAVPTAVATDEQLFS
jgi:hypothetical protein